MLKRTNLPSAHAVIRGGNGYPALNGRATFLQTPKGVLVTVEVNGLPKNEVCNDGIFALHIHEGENCTGTAADEFSDAKTHFNPDDCQHPYHAGDLPPLIGNNGYGTNINLIGYKISIFIFFEFRKSQILKRYRRTY